MTPVTLPHLDGQTLAFAHDTKRTVLDAERLHLMLSALTAVVMTTLAVATSLAMFH